MERNRIAEIRKARNFTQAKLAKVLNVAQNTVSSWERGTREPDFLTLKKLCHCLNCSLDCLLGISAEQKGHTSQDMVLIRKEMYKLKAANERLGRQLHAAQRDLAQLDSCQVCGWNDNGSCKNQNKKSGSCFAWRGAERARLWENGGS